MINLRFKQDKFVLVDVMACMLNMYVTQNTTKITFSKVSEEDLFTELKLLKYYETKWCY
jgi:hypothetical protein